MSNEALDYWSRRWFGNGAPETPKPKLRLVKNERPKRTHCRKGHAYTKHGEVHFWGGTNVRVCRICRAKTQVKYWLKVGTGWRAKVPWDFVGRK